MANPSTPLEKATELEAVYYSAPVPRNRAVLTAMGLIFDRVYFPGTYLPLDELDVEAIAAERNRIANLDMKFFEDDIRLLSVLSFLPYAHTLRDFCVFEGSWKDVYDEKLAPDLLSDLAHAFYGPTPPSFSPIITNNHSKALPGGGEIFYRGMLHHSAGALVRSGATGIPLVNDVPGLPVPGAPTSPTNDAGMLATILAVECVKLMIPDALVMTPADLMEFRADNAKHLRAFRSAMLRYAAKLNGELKGVAPEDVAQHTDFFVKTEIVPTLNDLGEAARNPSRSMVDRGVELVRMVPELIPSLFSVAAESDIAQTLMKTALPFLLTDVVAKAHKNAELKRSGLYYLLRVGTLSGGVK